MVGPKGGAGASAGHSGHSAPFPTAAAHAVAPAGSHSCHATYAMPLHPPTKRHPCLSCWAMPPTPHALTPNVQPMQPYHAMTCRAFATTHVLPPVPSMPRHPLPCPRNHPRHASYAVPLHSIMPCHALHSLLTCRPCHDMLLPLQEAADFVLEIGCEELPPADVSAALEQLRCTCALDMN